MCGRFTIDIDARFYPRFLLHGKPILNLTPRYNLAPGQDSYVITHSDAGNQAESKRWGLLPVWAKEEKSGYSMINAKAETLFEKPAYKQAVLKRRCLVPATGFYEWQPQTNGTKQPLYIYNPEDKYLAFAGIYESWHDPVTGKEINTFSIITTAPNHFMETIHERMPLILDHQSESLWLRPEIEIPALENILKTIPQVPLQAYLVGKGVNSPRNDNPGLIARLSE